MTAMHFKGPVNASSNKGQVRARDGCRGYIWASVSPARQVHRSRAFAPESTRSCSHRDAVMVLCQTRSDAPANGQGEGTFALGGGLVEAATPDVRAGTVFDH